LEVNYTHHHVLSISDFTNAPNEVNTFLDTLSRHIQSSSPSKNVSLKRRVENDLESPIRPASPIKSKSIVINGRSLTITASVVPDPPGMTYKTKADLEQLMRDWTSGASVTLRGIPIPLCYWKELYSHIRPAAWTLIKTPWGRYRMFVAAVKSFPTIEEFWACDALAMISKATIEKGCFTAISDALRIERIARDKADTARARTEYSADEFALHFAYKKNGSKRVYQKSHDIARLYRQRKNASVYWDNLQLEEDSEAES
jgi:hypothetical protein